MTILWLSPFGKNRVPFNWTILLALVQEPLKNSGRPESLHLPVTSVCVSGSSLLSSSISFLIDGCSKFGCDDSSLFLSFQSSPNTPHTDSHLMEVKPRCTIFRVLFFLHGKVHPFNGLRKKDRASSLSPPTNTIRSSE